MDELASWVTPLLLLPGIGLLLVSTSARYEALHVEIHTLLAERGAQAAACAGHTLRRARLLRDALVALYSSAATLAAAGLVGAVSQWWSGTVHAASWLLTIAAVAALVGAAVQLVRESVVSLQVVRGHAEELRRDA